jgi:hypothetical protein
MSPTDFIPFVAKLSDFCNTPIVSTRQIPQPSCLSCPKSPGLLHLHSLNTRLRFATQIEQQNQAPPLWQLAAQSSPMPGSKDHQIENERGNPNAE